MKESFDNIYSKELRDRFSLDGSDKVIDIPQNVGTFLRMVSSEEFLAIERGDEVKVAKDFFVLPPGSEDVPALIGRHVERGAHGFTSVVAVKPEELRKLRLRLNLSTGIRYMRAMPGVAHVEVLPPSTGGSWSWKDVTWDDWSNKALAAAMGL